MFTSKRNEIRKLPLTLVLDNIGHGEDIKSLFADLFASPLSNSSLALCCKAEHVCRLWCEVVNGQGGT